MWPAQLWLLADAVERRERPRRRRRR
jgi:hypothetical protein